MAAPLGNDRKLAAEIRRLTLRELEKILLGEDNDYKKQVILKLAPTVLPRLNEHTGEDGAALFPKPLLGGESNVPNNNSNQEATEPDEAN